MRNAQLVIDEYVELQESDKLARGTLLEALVLFYKWLQADQCVIRDINANLIPLRPNRAQQILLAKAILQAASWKPVRLIVLKARKVGISTFIQVLYFFLCAHYPNRLAIMLAHEARATEEIFGITKRTADNYNLVTTIPIAHQIRFPENDSRYYCRTAGGQGVGAGGTPNYLHHSEVAKWFIRAEETHYVSSNAVPDTNPDTIIIDESTANGRELFWAKYEAAANDNNPFEQIFIPWYYDDVLKAPVVGVMHLDSEEMQLITQARADGIDLSLEALQWRRNKIATIGEDIFRQEYPSTPEEAVQATKGLILPGIRNCLIDSLPFSIDAVDTSQRVGGIDYGYYDATVIISAVYIDQVLYVFDIYHKEQGLAGDHVKHLKSGFNYFIDPSAPAGRNELLQWAKKLGIKCKITQAPMNRLNGQVVVPQLRKVKNLISEGKLRVLRSCADRLIIEADSYAWNPRTGEPNDTRSEFTGHFDTISALRYLVAGATLKDGRVPHKVKAVDDSTGKLIRRTQLARV